MENNDIQNLKNAAKTSILNIIKNSNGSDTGVWSVKEVIAMNQAIVLLADELLKRGGE